MKKLLVILGILFSLGTSAQTMLYDTTIVKSPMGVIITSGAKDSLYIREATASQNGYMTAVAMTQLASLVAGNPSYPTTNVQSASSYTLQTSDFNKMVNMTSGSVTTVVVPTSLPNGWSCKVMQSGGIITISAGAGATIRSPFNYKRSQTQYSVITIVALGSNIYSVSGNLKQ